MAKKPSILRIQKHQWSALVALMLPFVLFCQGSIEVDGTVRDKDSNRKLAGVQVEVLQNGQPYDAVSTLSSGKYTLSLDHGADYSLRFTLGDLSPRIGRAPNVKYSRSFSRASFLPHGRDEHV